LFHLPRGKTHSRELRVTAGTGIIAQTAGILREFCVDEYRTVMLYGAFVATGAPANRLMQLMLRIPAGDWVLVRWRHNKAGDSAV